MTPMTSEYTVGPIIVMEGERMIGITHSALAHVKAHDGRWTRLLYGHRTKMRAIICVLQERNNALKEHTQCDEKCLNHGEDAFLDPKFENPFEQELF